MSNVRIIHGDCMEAMKAMPDKAYEDKRQMVRKSNERSGFMEYKNYIQKTDFGKIKLYQADCMEMLPQVPDKYYDLCICDPPYGIGNFVPQNISKQGKQAGKEVCWNNDTPNNKYFSEITRVAKTQIIWGANYYNCFNKDGGAIVWHKGNINPIFSQCEIASISSQKRVDYIFINWQSGFHRNNIENVIHPCQKPVALYQWLLKNYAKPGDRILDTHGGSCSIAIACDIMGFDLDCYEIDEDYYRAAVERFERHKQQTVLEFST